MKPILFVIAAIVVLAGCGGDHESAKVDAGPRDASVDGGMDAAAHHAPKDAATNDAQIDASADASVHDAATADTGLVEDDSGVDAGNTLDCSAALACPNAAANKVTVCGRFYDVETDGEVHAKLAISFYDAVELAGNPTGATVLVPQTLDVDDCGRFVAENIARPSNGFLALLVDDAAGASDDHRATVSAFSVASGEVRGVEKAYAVRKSTDTKWSNDVGFGASTFVDRGALLAIFYHGNTPVSGVTVTSNGAARASDDYYFSDGAAMARTSVTATGPTQLDGATLFLNSTLTPHSGQGGEPVGCVWPSLTGVSVPGVLWMLPIVAQLSGGGVCP